MTQLRDHVTPMQQRAHRILDEVRAGVQHGATAINWALAVLGEPVEAA
jgi:hypothetical protein